MKRITIACPAAHTNDANSLAMVLGYGPADGLTYSNVGYQDALGNLYACASLPVGDSFVSTATSPLERPEWDVEPYQVNMAGATRAQALVVFWEPTEESPEPPLANPDAITAVAGEDGVAMLAAMGLTTIPQEEGLT
jgi:hypothetical protein